MLRNLGILQKIILAFMVCPASITFPHQRQLHFPKEGRCAAVGLGNF